MASNLTYLSLNNLGINGVNTQANAATLSPEWLTKADNIAFKESGRITFRKGFVQEVMPLSSLTAIESLAEYLTPLSTYDLFCGANNNIYQVDLTSPDDAFTSVYNTDITANDWQFINFNNKMVALQSGHVPLTYNGTDWLPIGIDTSTTVTVGNFQTGATYKIVSVGGTTQAEWETAGLGAGITAAIDIEFVASSAGITALGTPGTTNPRTGNPPTNVDTFDPSCGTGYYGRIWAGGVTENKAVVYYSDTLIETEWRTSGADGVAGSGDDTSAGYIDLATVWGQDEIVAIEPFYGQLVIFGKHNIAIYKNPTNFEAMSLVEVIRGIGCVSRDSVKQVADDLFFLSPTGLRSLSRTTEKDNIPLQDLSLTVKDNIIRDISSTTNFKSVYVEDEGIYILTFVDIDIVYVFDMKHLTPLRTPRVTFWNFKKPGAFTINSLIYSESNGLLAGQEGGSIARYAGFEDKELIEAGVSKVYDDVTSYTGIFVTTWIDLGEGVTAALLKKLKAVIGGGAGTSVEIKWNRDFGIDTVNALTTSLSPVGVDYLYGIADFCVDNNSVRISDATYHNATPYDYTGGDMCIYEDDGLSYDLYVEEVAPGGGDTEPLYVENTITPGSPIATRNAGSNFYFCHPLSDELVEASSPVTEYASTKGLKEYNIPLSRSAKHVQFTFTAQTGGSSTVLQDLTLLFKRGKIR